MRSFEGRAGTRASGPEGTAQRNNNSPFNSSPFTYGAAVFGGLLGLEGAVVIGWVRKGVDRVRGLLGWRTSSRGRELTKRVGGNYRSASASVERCSRRFEQVGWGLHDTQGGVTH